jgi:cytochrome c553
MRICLLPTLAASCLALALSWPAVECAAAAESPKVNFARDVKPILARKCFACHGPTANEGGLRLHEQAASLAELDSGLHAIVPGNEAESALLERVSTDDEIMRMPPEGKPLTPAEIEILRAWIAAGAKYEKHWAFVPPVRHEPPAVSRQDWVHNPIDAFVLNGVEAAGLAPAPPADRRTLARRAFFDLTGLPPTEEELAEFLADEAPDAYARLIDKLLASPHYGERWARHWLDLVRFAETNSFERDGVKPNAWKYRDYVIRSLNDDKPYDQFLREQLAGDELDEVTDDTIIATGFYRLGLWDDEPADSVQALSDHYDDLVSTTSQAMLGLTVGCARCHDHKIDPIPQTNYYGLVAFFADVAPYGARGVDPATYSQWVLEPAEQRGERAEMQARIEAVRQELVALEEAGIKRMSAPDQRRSEGPEREALLREQLEQHLNVSEWEMYQGTRTRLRRMERQMRRLPRPDSALALAKCNPRPEPTHLMVRGNPHVPGDVVEPHFPTLFGVPAPKIPEAPAGARSAGRRRVLAEWMTSPDNMLTARVIVNRVWQHHFGRGIVRSSSNFGELGTPPTHPELLDWLALWLIDNDWKLKPLHRLIMASNTYQMSSRGNEQAIALDPTNDLFWRFDMRRLGAEEVRDATLVTTGELNPAMFGPGFYETLPDDVLATQSKPGDGWGNSPPDQQRRRSIYIHVKRSLLPPLLTAFDFPDVDATCEARFNTVQPGQALALVNGKFFNDRAGKLAERVVAEAGDQPREQVAAAVRIALGRAATDDEIADGLALMTRLVEEHGQEPREALRYWCLTALNLNEYLFLD